MKALTTKAITGLGVAGVTCTSVAGAWYMSRPKDVKSKLVSEGLTLVGDSSRAWRSVFLTHKDDAEFISFAGVTTSNSDKDEASKVSDACNKALKVEVKAKEYDSTLEKARKYCTAPKFKTVEAQVLFSDKEPSAEDRDWKDSFVLNKDDPSFISKVNAINFNANISGSTQTSEAKEKVEKFCNDLKSQKPDSQNVSDYEKYCLQTPTTIKTFYEKQGYSMVGENDWGDKFDAIKSEGSTLFTAIQGSGTTLNDHSTKEQGGPKLKAWCNKEVVKEINIADKKTKDRCFN